MIQGVIGNSNIAYVIQQTEKNLFERYLATFN